MEGVGWDERELRGPGGEGGGWLTPGAEGYRLVQRD